LAADTHDLASLLNPIPLDRFFAEYWERQPLHLVRGVTDFYQSLISASDLERIIANPDARYPALQLAKGGHYFAPESYTSTLKFGSEVFAGVPDLQTIIREYRQGASVVLPALHRTWEPLRDLCALLDSQLDHAAHANAYLTPGNAAGFTPHYDTHEVFVLQIAGCKRWSLYPAPIKLPHRSQPFDPTRYDAPAPVQQLHLLAGDLLYLPRGTVHSAATSNGFSAHITVGVTVYAWVDLIRDLLETSINDEELRRALPPGFASGADLKPQLRIRLVEALEQLRHSDIDAFIDRFARRVLSARTPTVEKFRADITVPDDDRTLSCAATSRFRIIREAKGAVLEFDGKRHVFPKEAVATLEAIATRQSFRASELPRELSVDATRGLIRYLLGIEFLAF